MFRGKITDMFTLQDKGHVPQFTQVVGEPAKGMTLTIAHLSSRVLEVGKNFTDGQVVSDRSCLTGQTIAPYCVALVEWAGARPDPKTVCGSWAEGDTDHV
ncbi:hypothetical protein [uncultured Tateyamaria sp.]|uniref:hypothetical protein n=1 Tax=uncultured Tateyamaria sp. TaxID=455651 RepID=UPI002610708F|nr:hypothetical protein [uncultured Tateyamaria sp.]